MATDAPIFPVHVGLESHTTCALRQPALVFRRTAHRCSPSPAESSYLNGSHGSHSDSGIRFGNGSDMTHFWLTLQTHWLLSHCCICAQTTRGNRSGSPHNIICRACVGRHIMLCASSHSPHLAWQGVQRCLQRVEAGGGAGDSSTTITVRLATHRSSANSPAGQGQLLS